jgi:hypothetical protein
MELPIKQKLTSNIPPEKLVQVHINSYIPSLNI